MAQAVKNLPAKQETWAWSLGQEDPLGEGMAGDGEGHGRGGRRAWQGMEKGMAGNGEGHGRGWRRAWQGMEKGMAGDGEGHGSPLQYACLGHPMDRGAWQATVHGVPKSRT